LKDHKNLQSTLKTEHGLKEKESNKDRNTSSNRKEM